MPSYFRIRRSFRYLLLDVPVLHYRSPKRDIDSNDAEDDPSLTGDEDSEGGNVDASTTSQVHIDAGAYGMGTLLSTLGQSSDAGLEENNSSPEDEESSVSHHSDANDIEPEAKEESDEEEESEHPSPPPTRTRGRGARVRGRILRRSANLRNSSVSRHVTSVSLVPFPPDHITERFIRDLIPSIPAHMPINLDSLSEEYAGTLEAILVAIYGSPGRRLTSQEIYRAICRRFPHWDQERGTKWRGNIRHKLTLKNMFVLVDKPKGYPGNGKFWMINASMGLGETRKRTVRKRNATGKGGTGKSRRSKVNKALIDSDDDHEATSDSISMRPFPEAEPSYSKTAHAATASEERAERRVRTNKRYPSSSSSSAWTSADSEYEEATGQSDSEEVPYRPPAGAYSYFMPNTNSLLNTTPLPQRQHESHVESTPTFPTGGMPFGEAPPMRHIGLPPPTMANPGLRWDSMDIPQDLPEPPHADSPGLRWDLSSFSLPRQYQFGQSHGGRQSMQTSQQPGSQRQVSTAFTAGPFSHLPLDNNRVRSGGSETRALQTGETVARTVGEGPTAAQAATRAEDIAARARRALEELGETMQHRSAQSASGEPHSQSEDQAQNPAATTATTTTTVRRIVRSRLAFVPAMLLPGFDAPLQRPENEASTVAGIPSAAITAIQGQAVRSPSQTEMSAPSDSLERFRIGMQGRSRVGQDNAEEDDDDDDDDDEYRPSTSTRSRRGRTGRRSRR